MYLRLGLLVIHVLGAGSFNVGDNVSVYNYQSATTVNDSDVVDQAIIGSTKGRLY